MKTWMTLVLAGSMGVIALGMGHARPQPAAGGTSAGVRSDEKGRAGAGGVVELVRAGDLVTAQRGTIPIIITAPHGGQVRVPGSKDRTKGVMVRDDMTAELALLVAQRVTAKLGGKPSVVVAQFSRKDADANRSPESGEAFETDAARKQYEAFHGAVRTVVDEARGAHPGRVLLIDLHGQKRVEDAIIRGTRDGKTVGTLVKRCGEEALTGPKSLCGRLHAAGYHVLPEIREQGEDAAEKKSDRHPLDEANFDGGYIVEHYGAMSPNGVDAIQLEIGKMRNTETMKLARELGDAIAGFYEEYMAKGEEREAGR